MLPSTGSGACCLGAQDNIEQVVPTNCNIGRIRNNVSSTGTRARPRLLLMLLLLLTTRLPQDDELPIHDLHGERGARVAPVI